MTDTPDCRTERRRKVRESKHVFGLDFVLVCPGGPGGTGREFVLFFLGTPPAHLRPENVDLRCAGSAHRLAVSVSGEDVDPADGIRIRVLDRVGPGDYTLALDLPAGSVPAVDPFFNSLTFAFDPPAAAGSDCGPPAAAPRPPVPPPDINYLAKDYATFRQLLLDRLAVTMPAWQERSPADVGIMLVEVLAYAADHLSYYQDAVATEAYLGTARLRQSLRRHARLVDYRVHEGCNARTWMAIEAGADHRIEHPQDLFFLALPHGSAPGGRALTQTDLDRLAARPHGCTVFEPVASAAVQLWRGHNACELYDWQGAAPCLPAGATSADLIDDPDPARKLHLCKDEVVIFEEVRGPWTGAPADADPTRRHAVRITKIDKVRDDLEDKSLYRITWGEADALPFPLWISRPPTADWGNQAADPVTVVRGNVLLVDHGRTVTEQVEVGPASAVPPGAPAAYPRPNLRARLAAPDLTFSAEPPAKKAPAAGQFAQDPRQATPQLVLRPAADERDRLGAVTLLELRNVRRVAGELLDRLLTGSERSAASFPAAARRARRYAGITGVEPSQAAALADLGAFRAALQDDLRDVWLPRYDLIESGPTDSHFAVEMTDERAAELRFGRGGFGRSPELGDDGTAILQATYRIGNGTAGNVPADAVCGFGEYHPTGASILVVRNPLPAAGGTDAESPDEIRLYAPTAARKRLERAVTPADYAAIVRREFGSAVQQVRVTTRWTGHEAEVLVAVDPLGRETADPKLLAAIQEKLTRYRRIGHKVVVRGAARVVPYVGLTVCVAPHAIREQVRDGLNRRFSDRVLPDRSLGLFHPDRVTFGDGVYVSQLVAAAAAVPGVVHAEVAHLYRSDTGEADELQTGVLRLRPGEIVRFDNDPRHPEFGRLRIDLKGGR